MTEAFGYVRAATVDEALAALAEDDGGSSLLAGGTDLLVDIRNGVRAPRRLIDIKGIEALHELRVDRQGIRIGAAVPLNRLAELPAIRESIPALATAALAIGTYQIRNRGTLVGNVCNASPAADAAPILLVLNAEVEARGPSGARRIPMCELFTGVKRTCLSRDELVVAIRLPAPSADLRTGFLKQGRIRGHDLAVVNVAGAFFKDRGTLSVAIGSCGPTPTLLETVDVRDGAADAAADRVLGLAEAAVSPIDDVRASSAHRRAVLEALLRRLCADLLSEEAELCA